jgi:hypothetical protein
MHSKQVFNILKLTKEKTSILTKFFLKEPLWKKFIKNSLKRFSFLLRLFYFFYKKMREKRKS